MKKLLVLLVLAGAGYLAYHQATLPGPTDAYEKFADAWARGHHEEALKFAKGDAVASALERKPLAGLMNASTMEAFRGTRYTILSTSELQDGDLLIQANQTIAFDPPGAATATSGAMYAAFRHSATVRKTPAGWKVVSFDPTFLEVGQTRKR